MPSSGSRPARDRRRCVSFEPAPSPAISSTSSRRPSTSQHRHPLGTVERLHDAQLEVGGEPFVQPEVAPRGVGDEVARPRVRELVRDQRRQRSIAGEDRRRRERQHRVLHAAERERRRHHQHVVAAPAIRAVERLGGRHHLLEIGELGGGATRRPTARRTPPCAAPIGRNARSPTRWRSGTAESAGSAGTRSGGGRRRSGIAVRA